MSQLSPSSPLRVTVAALTFRRPDDLIALIPMLRQQVSRVSDDVEILIVDNDPAGGARELVESYGSGVRYLHADEPGIAAARNAALDGSPSADVLIFIDDDERPSEDWLPLMLAAHRQHGAAAVVGPVISEFETAPEPWIQAGRFFTRRRMPTGSYIDIAATNNLLLDMRFVRGNGLRFDLRFGLTGGSDTLFSRELRAAGGRMVWCDEAIVTDVVPSNRSTRRWVLQRAYRSGNSLVLTALAVAHTPSARARTRAEFGARGLLRAASGAAMTTLGAVLRSDRWKARGRRTLARGRGMLGGVFGRAYAEYRRTD